MKKEIAHLDKEMIDLMMYMIGFAPRAEVIFQETYDDHKDRFSEKTVNELIDIYNHYYGLDIKYIEVKENE